MRWRAYKVTPGTNAAVDGFKETAGPAGKRSNGNCWRSEGLLWWHLAADTETAQARAVIPPLKRYATWSARSAVAGSGIKPGKQMSHGKPSRAGRRRASLPLRAAIPRKRSSRKAGLLSVVAAQHRYHRSSSAPRRNKFKMPAARRKVAPRQHRSA